MASTALTTAQADIATALTRAQATLDAATAGTTEHDIASMVVRAITYAKAKAGKLT